jgi:uncharacterized phage protein gp47/JayE
VLTLVNPLGGLSPQTATVDSSGLSGEDIEDKETWRTRILQRIRERGAGGDADDYVQWTHEVLPTALARALSPAIGMVTIAFAMPSALTWRVPTGPEIDAVQAYVNDASARKPLGAPEVDVIAVTLQPVDVTLSLNPDTTATRAAASNALALFFLRDAAIGGAIDVSRLDAAVSSASGEFSHERTAPSADTAAADATSLLTLGTVTFT